MMTDGAASTALTPSSASILSGLLRVCARCGAVEQDRRMADFEARKASLEVQRLRQRVEELEAGSQVANRPTSRERLPTMEGVTPAP